MNPGNSLLTALDKYKDISSNTWNENILFYSHPYNILLYLLQ